MLKNNYFIRKFLLSSLILSIFFISACSFKEIEKNAFIAAIGVDTSNNAEKPYKVTLKIFNPSNSVKQMSEPNYTYITEEGKTMTDAIRLLETKVDKKLEFGHLRFIILGEESLEKLTIEDLTDFLLRRADVQLISWIMIGRPSAKEIVEMIPQTETSAYPSLYNYFDQNANESPYVVSTFLFDFERRRAEYGLDPILPIIEGNSKNYIIDKSMVIGEEKNFMELDYRETKLYNVLKGHLVRADIMIEQEDEQFTVEVKSFKANYQTVENSNGSITLKLEINLTGIITESKNPLQIEKLNEYNQLSETYVKERITKILTKFTEKRIDPIGFGLNYRASRLHNNVMGEEEWKKAYENADLDIKVKVNIKTTGQD